MFLYITLLLLVNSLLSSSFLKNDLISAFFKNELINHGVILTCSKKKEQVKLLKYFVPNMSLMYASSNMYKVNHLALLYIKHGRMGVIFDGDCSNSNRIISLLGRHRFFDIKYYWLILSNSDIENQFSDAYINVDSNIHTISTNFISKNQFDIYDFFNPASENGGNFVITKIGFFNNLTGYRVNDMHNKFWRRRNFTGVVFNTIIVLHEPYFGTLDEYLQNNDRREENTYNRYHARLMKYCQHHYNFTLNINISNLFGYRKEDGTMDGLVGNLERRIIDFGMSPLFVRADRADVITFGRLTYTLRSAFVLLSPKSKEMFGLFLRPLSPSVWYCMLGFCTFTCFLIKGMSYFRVSHNTDTSWSHFVLCVTGMLSQQGIIIIPTVTSGRIILLFMLNLTYFVYMFYSGSLVSSLLNVPLDIIETVDDILNAKFKVGIEDNRFNKEYFKYTEDNASIRLYESMIVEKEHQVFVNATTGLRNIKAGDYAFHVEMAKAYPFIRDQLKEYLCEISEVAMYKSSQCYANYAKHSSFRDIMDVCLHRIAESGVMQKELTFWHTKKPECWYTYKINTGVDEIYPLLIYLIVGFIISILILFLEIIFVMLRKHSINRKIN